MKTILYDKTNQRTFIFSCKSDLLRYIDRKETTVWKWSKFPYKETEKYILYFNAEDKKSRNKKGNEANLRRL